MTPKPWRMETKRVWSDILLQEASFNELKGWINVIVSNVPEMVCRGFGVFHFSSVWFYKWPNDILYTIISLRWESVWPDGIIITWE